MKENSIEELKQRLDELYKTQQARLDVGADDLDIREEIAEVEETIKDLQDETTEKNSIEEAIERLEKGINDIWFSTTYSQEQEEKDLEILLSDYKRVLKENEKLKNIRYDTPYGTETIHLIPKSNLIEINTQKYMIEAEPGKFVDLKQVYLENKELKSRIPSLENGTYTGDIEGLLKLEKEIVKRDNEIKQLKEEVSQYKKIKEISENITLEDVEKVAKNYEKDYILREKVKEIAHELYYNNYKGNLDDGKFAQEMAKKLEKVLKESEG